MLAVIICNLDPNSRPVTLQYRHTNHPNSVTRTCLLTILGWPMEEYMSHLQYTVFVSELHRI